MGIKKKKFIIFYIYQIKNKIKKKTLKCHSRAFKMA
jgi:hypothetical protein